MVIVVHVKGLNRAHKLFAQLPKTLNQEIMKKSVEFMGFVKKSAKLRAPRFTGYLASSIFITKTKNQVTLKVTAPYAAAQEMGAGLPHYVSVRKLMPWFGASRTMGAGMMAPGLSPKKGMVVVRRYKPFIKPALEAGLANLPNMLINGTKKAIRRAGG